MCSSKRLQKWSKDGNPVDSRKLIHGQIMISDIRQQDSGQYSCHGQRENNDNFIAVSEITVGSEYIQQIVR